MAKILIIEDDLDFSELLKVNLSKEGWEIITADEGYKAVDLVVNSTPDLILLDLNLPYLDGDVVISLFNEKKITDQIPVIIMSGEEESRLQAAKEKIGAKLYIKKPLDIEKLKIAIKDTLA